MVLTLWSPTKVGYDKDALKRIKHWVKGISFGIDLRIKFKELYTSSHKPPKVIYEDLAKQKRVLRVDELYKFSDGTLKKFWDKIHHRVLDFRLGYNDEMSRREWTAIDRKRSQLMVELIDKQMRERRIIRYLERLRRYALSFNANFSTVKEFADADVSSLMDIPIQQETPQTQPTSAKQTVEEPIAEVIMDDVDKLDWNNTEGYCFPFDLSKPLPLQGPPSRQTIAADYFFNNDLEYLKTSNPEMPMRKWMAVDQRTSGLMIELIDKQLREREIIKILERLVGARELEMDYKLMTRTI
nr:hypothetical protein [Tanacetum cinerariifolium]